MPIEITCSACDRRLRVQDQTAGKRIKCPKCQNVLRVPDVAGDASQAGVGSNPGQSNPGQSTGGQAESWHVKTTDGQSYGPVSRAELDQWVQQGRVDAECQLLLAGAPNWQWAGEVYPQLVAPQAAPTQAAPTHAAPMQPGVPQQPGIPQQPAAHVPVGAPAGSNHPGMVGPGPVGQPAGQQGPFDFAEPHSSPTTRYGKGRSRGGRGRRGGTSDKSRIVAGLLALFVGNLGIHRFYLGHMGLGVCMLLTLGGCGIWSLIDAIMIFTGSVRDADGRELKD